MPVFQVASRTVQSSSGAPGPRPSRASRKLIARLRVIVGVLLVIALIVRTQYFIFFPALLSIVLARSQRYHLNVLLNGTLVYRVLTIGLALVYYCGIAGVEIITHPPSVDRVILVSTTLVWTVLLDPLRAHAQTFIEQRFNVRDREANHAIDIFTSTLREEIDLDKVCASLLSVIQQTMQPQAVALWVSKSIQHDAVRSLRAGDDSNNAQVIHETQAKEPVEQDLYGPLPGEITLADDDPFMTYALRDPGLLEVDKLQFASPILHTLKIHAVEIILPLLSQGELVGMLTLGPHLDWMEYTQEDRRVLTMLATQLAPALRVAQMVKIQQGQVRERERIEQELRTAQAIQHTFLPKDVPTRTGWQLARYYQSAREVGGDFYDFLPFADGRLGIVIGDVTDKGIPAALVMTATRTMLRTAALEKASPAEVLAQVNNLLAVDIPVGMFVTCFYAILDPKSGRLLYANAGHEPPYRRYNGSVVELWATGMPLGMLPGTSYDEYETTIAPGESLLFYSDGLVEAHNPAREMFGFPRLATLLATYTDEVSPIAILLDELQCFTGAGWEQEDDVTLVTLQRMSKTVVLDEPLATPQLQ